ncbi:MAG: sensor histidine kinase, partial [Acidimicrobiales bacterium]
RLLDDLRTLSMTEAGMVTLEKERTDLGELVNEITDRFQTQATASHVELRVEAAEAVEVLIDPYRIGQVVSNLLVNALRAVSEGDSITVTVRSGELRGVGAGLVAVEDTGRGIPVDEVEAVFDRFHKGDDSTGSGLGLTISRDLVTAHGGTISISSRVGTGTTATVVLPVAGAAHT